jgi:undecaprenyl-diphosphatase
MRTAEYGKKPLWIAFSLILCVLAAGVLAAWHYLLAPYRYPSGAVPFDYRIVLFLNRFARRSWAFDTFVGLLDSNPLAMAPVVLAFWWAWFRKSENQVRDREYLIFGIVGTASAVLAARIVAAVLPFRERPLRNPLLHFQLPYGVHPERLLGWNSFPSDHGALWFALAATLLCVSRRAGILLFLYVSGVLAVARIYLGIHYPGDIIAGGLLGLAAVSLGSSGGLRSRISGPLLAWMESAPHAFYACLFAVTFEMTECFASVVQIGIYVHTTSRALLHFL